jgi:hypothetical protein
MVKLDGVLQTSGYTITGVNVTGGGQVIFSVTHDGAIVELSRSTPIDQLSTYLQFEQNDLTAAQAMESGLDKLTMMIQELRALQVPFIEVVAVANGASSVTITHNLNTLTPKLISFISSWNTIVTPDEPTDPNELVLQFSSQAPATGSPTVTVTIAPSENFITAQFTGVNDPGIVALTNRTGGALVAGDVVTGDTSNDSSVALADTVTTKKQLLVSIDAADNLATGRFITHGLALVRVASATTRGHYLTKSATTKAAVDSGTAIGDSTNIPQGAFAVALSSSAGAGFVVADLLGLTYSAPTTVVTSITTQVIAVSANYVKPAGLLYVDIEMVGGGGGSGGIKLASAQRAATGGGSSAAWSKKRLMAAALAASESVTIGAGGTAGGDTGTNGGNGGDTIFGASLLVAKGGLGSNGTTTNNSVTEGAAGGPASSSVGDVTADGDDGGSPSAIFTATISVWRGGDGAGSKLGSRIKGLRAVAGVQAGQAGRNYGSGASGAAVDVSTTGAAGAVGGVGVCIVTEYKS